MKSNSLRKVLFIVFLFTLSLANLIFAFTPSPAGGGWLEVSKSGGYAFVENHEDFGKNLVNEFTLEMWFYMKRAPRFGEVWVLFHKEGSYLITLSGHILGINCVMHHFREPRIAIDYSYRCQNGGGTNGTSISIEELPLNQWHHIAAVHDENGYQLYIDGIQLFTSNREERVLKYSDSPFCIGGTGIKPSQFWCVKSWTKFSEGLIDEVRVSNKARYPVKSDNIIPIKIEIPQGRLESDGNTLALWHFDGSRDEWLEDASGHGHTLKAVDLNYYSVNRSGRLPAVWGQIKR